MADISVYLAKILSAVYGEDVRGSIHDAIEIINDVSEVVLSTGTAITGPTSSSTGFYEDSLYLNTNTYELWKCTGTDTWVSLGILKGSDGNPGPAGDDGNKWYLGTGISGKAVLPTVYSGSGVTDANENDFYLNPSEGAVYHCTLGGAPSVATWVYDFTMSGGGGGTTYTAGTGIDISVADVISVDPGSIASGVLKPPTAGDVYTALQGKADTSSLGDLAYIAKDGVGSTKVLQGDGTWVTPSSGGHTMISNSGYEATMITHAADPTDDDVASAYVIANWSNCNAKVILTTASQGADGIGTWEADNVWETSGVRTGWLWSADLYRVLEDGSGNRNYNVEAIPVFDCADSETVGLLSWRIDDNYSHNGTPGGCVAFKFTGAIQNATGVKVGVKLVYQRTEVNDTGTTLS